MMFMHFLKELTYTFWEMFKKLREKRQRWATEKGDTIKKEKISLIDACVDLPEKYASKCCE